MIARAKIRRCCSIWVVSGRRVDWLERICCRVTRVQHRRLRRHRAGIIRGLRRLLDGRSQRLMNRWRRGTGVDRKQWVIIVRRSLRFWLGNHLRGATLRALDTTPNELFFQAQYRTTTFAIHLHRLRSFLPWSSRDLLEVTPDNPPPDETSDKQYNSGPCRSLDSVWAELSVRILANQVAAAGGDNL